MAKTDPKDIRVTAILDNSWEKEVVELLANLDDRTASAYVRRLIIADIDAAKKDGRLKKAEEKAKVKP